MLVSRPVLRASVALAVLLVGSWGGTQAQQLPMPVPVDGVPAGPFYFLPSIGISASAETNPFYQPEPEGDYIGRLNPRLGVMLPFSKSYVRFLYDGTFRRYAYSDVDDTDSRDLVGEMSLQFASSDRLVALVTKTAGASETLRFDGGETTYDATPFRYTVYTGGAQRIVPGRFGYEAAFRYSKLAFEQTEVNFFNFHGYDVTADANVPLAAHLWLVAGAAVRRYDHEKTDDPPGTVFREEHTDILRAGVRGVLAGDGGYQAILGYDRSVYPPGVGSDSPGVGSDFRGVIVDATMRWPATPSTAVMLTASRKPWSSFYGDNNYYVANVVAGNALYTMRGRNQIGAALELGTSAYPDPVNVDDDQDPSTPPVPIVRRDNTLRGEVYMVFALPHRCGFRIGYDIELRRSNVDLVGYTAQSAGVQFFAGWR